MVSPQENPARPSAASGVKPVILDTLGRIQGAIAPALTFVALVLIWEGACRYYEVPTWLLPAPSEIGVVFREFGGELWRNTLVTLYETITGFILAIVVTIPLAVLIVASPFLRKTIYPILLARHCGLSLQQRPGRGADGRARLAGYDHGRPGLRRGFRAGLGHLLKGGGRLHHNSDEVAAEMMRHLAGSPDGDAPVVSGESAVAGLAADSHAGVTRAKSWEASWTALDDPVIAHMLAATTSVRGRAP